MPAAPERPEPAAVPESVMAFDVGSRRIGVAIGQRITGDGRGLTVIEADGHAAALVAIAALIAQWRPQTLLVGRPLTLDGREQPASERARGFARAVGKRFGLPVLAIDERNTSRDAAVRFAAGRKAGLKRRSDSEQLDADAAAVLIQRFYDNPSAHLDKPVS